MQEKKTHYAFHEPHTGLQTDPRRVPYVVAEGAHVAYAGCTKVLSRIRQESAGTVSVAVHDYNATIGTLRIEVAACDDLDILPLLKAKLLEPSMSISVTCHATVAHCNASWTALLNNQNSTWTHWITNDIITRVRITTLSQVGEVDHRCRGFREPMCLDLGILERYGEPYKAKLGIEIPGLRVVINYPWS